MALTTSNAYTQLLILNKIKDIKVDDIISQMNIILSDPNATLPGTPQVSDYNVAIANLKALVDSLETF